MKPVSAPKVLPHAESTVRCPERRLQATLAQGKKRSRLPAAAGIESPSSVTQKAALELWSGGATRLLLHLMGRDIPPYRMSRIQLSAAEWAAAKESARITPANGSTA